MYHNFQLPDIPSSLVDMYCSFFTTLHCFDIISHQTLVESGSLHFNINGSESLCPDDTCNCSIAIVNKKQFILKTTKCSRLIIGSIIFNLLNSKDYLNGIMFVTIDCLE